MPPQDYPPRWLWRTAWTGIALVVVVLAAGVLILWRGAADPPLAGRIGWQDAALRWAGGPLITLAPGQSAWWTAPPAARLDPARFTLAVRARLDADSDPGAAWGVWLAAEDGARIVYAISGEQYTTTRRCPAALDPGAALEDCPALHPDWRWMPYPQIRLPGTANAITLHRETLDMVRLRLNGEIMGIAPLAVSGSWGVWARGGRAAPARLEWEWAGVYGGA